MLSHVYSLFDNQKILVRIAQTLFHSSKTKYLASLRQMDAQCFATHSIYLVTDRDYASRLPNLHTTGRIILHLTNRGMDLDCQPSLAMVPQMRGPEQLGSFATVQAGSQN